jgi:opacity protein-like surface antigen
MREHLALAAGIALACVSSASLAADIPTDVSVPVPEEIASRFYVSFHGGYTFGNKSRDEAYDTDPTTGPTAPNLGPTFLSDSFSKPGYRVGGAIGLRQGNLSLEAEVGYSHSAIDHVHLISTNGVPSPADLPATGSGSLLTGMVNAFLGTDIGNIRPYVGAGVGVGHFTANNITTAGAFLDGGTTGLAAQGLIGVDFALTGNATLGARYRYLYVADLSLMDGGYKHNFDLTSQSVEIVFTNAFN